MNLYAYAGNNPISFSDPFGLKVTVGQELASYVPRMGIESSTFARIFNALDRNGSVHLVLTGCSAGCPQNDVLFHGGGFFQGRTFRQDVWVDDTRLSGSQLIGRIAHEMVEAAMATDQVGTGITCNEGEGRHACVERWEDIIRSELEIQSREAEAAAETAKQKDAR